LYTYNNDSGRGGGLQVSGAAIITQSLFAGNSAPDGGAISSQGLVRLSAGLFGSAEGRRVRTAFQAKGSSAGVRG
jgi:predicted outer membrane repeat protein